MQRVFAHAESLRSQLSQLGKASALAQLDFKHLGISSSAISKDDMKSVPSQTIFNLLIVLANKQKETTTDPSRVTYFEKRNFETEGDLLKQYQCDFISNQIDASRMNSQLRSSRKRTPEMQLSLENTRKQ